MPAVDTLTTIGALGRVNDTPMVDNHPSDHDTDQQKLDAITAAAKSDIDTLWPLLTEIGEVDVAGRLSPANGVAPFPNLAQKLAGVALNPPVSGYLGYPVANLSRWRASASALRQVVLIGDSITQGNGVVGPYDFWWQRLARELGSDLGPLVGYGFRGLWQPEWASNGSWTQILPSSAADVTPFAEGFQATGSSTTHWTWTKPAGVTVDSFDIYYIDIPGSAWSYKIDGGGAVNGPASVGDNTLKVLHVNAPVTASVIIRCGSAVGSTAPAAFAGATFYSVANGWNGPGFIFHNLGRGSACMSYLGSLGASTIYPFWRDDSSSPVTSVGGATPGTGWGALLDMLQPDLVICEGFINDYGSASDTSRLAQYEAGFTALAERVTGYTDAFGFPKTDLLFWPTYVGPGFYAAVQAQFRAGVAGVAAAIGAAVLDISEAWAAEYGYATNVESEPLLVNQGGIYIHPNQPGNIDIAARMSRLLRAFS